MFANMYAVLTTLYGDNPRISDWLGIGPTLTSFSGVAVASLTQAVVLGWAFFQLRDEAIDDLAEAVRTSGRERPKTTGPATMRPSRRRPDEPPDAGAPSGRADTAAARAAARAGDGVRRPARAGTWAPEAPLAPAGPTVLPAWDDARDATSLGPWAWFRARLGDRPARADRSATLTGERGGRIDKLDLWILAVLADRAC